MQRFQSIGLKIYAIALGLVVLMTVVSAISFYMVDKVRDELQLQASVFLPLSNRLASMEATILEGEIVIERLRHDLEDDRGGVTSDEVRRRMKRIGEMVEEELIAIRALMNAADIDALEKAAAIAMTRTDATLDAIEVEYGDYRQGLDLLLTAEASGEIDQMRLLNRLLIVEEGEIYDQLERLRADMQDYVRGAVDHIVELDIVLDRLIIALTLLAAASGLILSALVTRRIVTPMRSLVAGLKRVEEGDLETRLDVLTQDETATMARGFNDMISGLRAKERITETFGKYVDSRVVDTLIGNPALTKPGGDRRHMSIMFSDMSGFTGLSERLSPDALVTLLNAYFTEISAPIQQHEGVIDKFIGDAIMAYWGPPFVDPRHQATAATSTAMDQLRLVMEFRKKVPDILGVRLDDARVDMHIGIATGPALVGTVGSAQHRNYTVMGDTVNVAARLEGACKVYRVRLLVDGPTRAESEGIVFREIDMLRVKGRAEPVHIHQPLGYEPLDEGRSSLARAFEQGLAAYRDERFDAAEKAFLKCLEIYPEDGPAKIFLERTRTLAEDPPPAGWDGVWTMTGK